MSLMSFIALDDDSEDLEDKETYKAMHARDQRRFKFADKDGDGIATKEEFTAFLHPEEFAYMRKLVVEVKGDAETHYHSNHSPSITATSFSNRRVHLFVSVPTGDDGGHRQERRRKGQFR